MGQMKEVEQKMREKDLLQKKMTELYAKLSECEYGSAQWNSLRGDLKLVQTDIAFLERALEPYKNLIK